MALNLPCQECVTKECKKKISCKHVDNLLGTGKTWRKHNTYNVDLQYIESTKPLSEFQLEVLEAIANLSSKVKEQLAERLSIKEAMNGSLLTDRQKQVIQLLIEGYKQDEIAKRLGISQQRVSRTIEKARKKLKNFLQGGVKHPQSL